MTEPERRSKKRYPIQLNLKYRSLSSRMAIAGTGCTVNVSSAGLLIASTHSLQQGVRLHVTVEWPWLLDQATPLQLVADSRVVRTGADEFAVTLERYQFRTSRRQALAIEPLIWAAQPITASS